MILLRVDTSIRAEGSISRTVADSVQQAWLDEHPGGRVVHRDLGRQPLSVDSWIAGHEGRFVPTEDRTAEQKQAVALAETLRDEVLAADALLIAAPLYNWGVPATLKLWIDLLMTLPGLGQGGGEPVAGRPAVLVIARGGGYAPGTPREGWDHSTPWLQRVLADVWHLQLRTVIAELTLADIVPAMAGLRDLAAQSLSEAHAAAGRHGREIAQVAAGSLT